jgi:hypothetical protein
VKVQRPSPNGGSGGRVGPTVEALGFYGDAFNGKGIEWNIQGQNEMSWDIMR